MTVNQNITSATENPCSGIEFSWLDLVSVLVKHKKKIVCIPALVAILASVYVLNLPDVYTATLRIAPSKNVATYSWLLSDEKVLDQAAHKIGLAKYYGSNTIQSTRGLLLQSVKVNQNIRNNFLDLNVSDKDPKVAAQIANQIGESLRENLYDLHLLDISKQRYDLEIRRSLALKNKDRFERELKEPSLAAAVALISVADRYGITRLAAIQAETSLQIIGGKPLVGEESDLTQLEAARLQDQLANLQRLVEENIKKQASNTNPGIWIATVDALQRQAYWTAVAERLEHKIELLKKQEFEDLKMTIAEAPEKKSGPRRLHIVLVSSVIALLFSVVMAFFIDFVAVLKKKNDTSCPKNKFIELLRGAISKK